MRPTSSPERTCRVARNASGARDGRMQRPPARHRVPVAPGGEPVELVDVDAERLGRVADLQDVVGPYGGGEMALRLISIARVNLSYAFGPGETWDEYKARMEMADRWSTPIAVGVSLIAIAALSVSLSRWRAR